VKQDFTINPLSLFLISGHLHNYMNSFYPTINEWRALPTDVVTFRAALILPAKFFEK